MPLKGRPLALLAGGGGAFLAVLAWLLFVPSGGDAPRQRPPFVLPTTLAAIEQRDLVPVVDLTGTIRALARAELAFDVAGIVSSLEVDEGSLVRAGQLLATTDGSEARAAVASREAELLVATRELELILAGVRPEERRRLAADLDVARAEERLAVLELERGEVLLQRDVLSAADLDRLRSQLEAARGRTASAVQRVAEAEAGPRPEDVAVAEARRSAAEAALAIARAGLDKTILRAPWSGVIARRRVSVGDAVARGQAVFELVDPDRLEVEVAVPSRHAARLGEEARAVLSLDEVPGFSLEATLQAQVPVADRLSRNFPALVRLDRARVQDAPRVLRPGMFVRLAVQLLPLPRALVVPADAVRVTDKGTLVVRAVPAAPPPAPPPQADAPPPPPGAPPTPTLQAELVPVRVLGADGVGRAIESLGPPLAAGDQVLVTGADLAFPGAPLLPRPVAGPEGAAAGQEAPR